VSVRVSGVHLCALCNLLCVVCSPDLLVREAVTVVLSVVVVFEVMICHCYPNIAECCNARLCVSERTMQLSTTDVLEESGELCERRAKGRTDELLVG
jgi:hypothetical protein